MIDNDHILKWFGLLVLCWFGAIAHYIKYLSETKEKFAAIDFIARLLCSAFAGVITHYFCVAISLNDAMTAGLIGLSGYMGAESMQLISNIIKSYFARK